jgi:hypothetical protein
MSNFVFHFALRFIILGGEENKFGKIIRFWRTRRPMLLMQYMFFNKSRQMIKDAIYSAFFLTVAIGNCMVKLIPPVNFCSDENNQTIFGTKFEDFLNYRTEYNSIS